MRPHARGGEDRQAGSSSCEIDRFGIAIASARVVTGEQTLAGIVALVRENEGVSWRELRRRGPARIC